MKRDFFKRFKFTGRGLAFSIIVIVISIIGFLLASHNINAVEVSTHPKDSSEIIGWEILKDCAVVIFSTFGVNLLLGLSIETSSQNKAFEEFFGDDVLQTSKFYEKLTREEKEKMLKGLELDYYYNGNDTLREMCKHSREKIISVTEDYYYANCNYVVKVTDKGSFFEKDVVNKISVMSYDDKTTIKKFPIARISHNKIAGLEECELVSVKLNNVDITARCKPEEMPFGKSGLETKTIIYYNNDLQLSSHKSQDFIMHFTTRCPKDDITSSFRASVPCKRFSLTYSIDSKDYRLIAHTFGCCEHAEDFSTTKHPDSATVTFDNLIYKDDGVVIVTCTK